MPSVSKTSKATKAVKTSRNVKTPTRKAVAKGSVVIKASANPDCLVINDGKLYAGSEAIKVFDLETNKLIKTLDDIPGIDDYSTTCIYTFTSASKHHYIAAVCSGEIYFYKNEKLQEKTLPIDMFDNDYATYMVYDEKSNLFFVGNGETTNTYDIETLEEVELNTFGKSTWIKSGSNDSIFLWEREPDNILLIGGVEYTDFEQGDGNRSTIRSWILQHKYKNSVKRCKSVFHNEKIAKSSNRQTLRCFASGGDFLYSGGGEQGHSSKGSIWRWSWDGNLKGQKFASVGATTIAVSGTKLFFNNRLATKSAKAIQVYDTETKKEIDSLTGHKGVITNLVANGGKLYSSSDDDTIRVWNV